MRTLLLIVASGWLALSAKAQTSLNLSKDLVRLGIAGRNLSPNTPELDSQPLFAAALQYVAANNISYVTAEHGDYYFLSSQTPYQYVIFPVLSHVVIDLAGSDLHFQYGLLRALEIDGAQDLTLRNFTIDSITPRFTQVKLDSVNAGTGTVAYSLLAGWADPAAFTASAFGSPQLFALFFRDGHEIAGTAISALNYPFAKGVLALTEDGAPWVQPNVLSTLQTGDTVVVWDRSGGEGILVDSSDGVTLANIEIHGTGGGFAVQVGRSKNSVAQNVRIVPRAGALISSNADGIHFTESISNNHIRRCFVTSTTDDALAMDSTDIATVVNQVGPRELVVTRQYNDRFPNGTEVDFVHPATGAETGRVTIVSQDPPDSPGVPFFGQVKLTFGQDLPALAAGDGMLFGGEALRGGGSGITDNVVDTSFGRGVFLGGLQDVVVARNTLRGLANAGIDVSQVTYPGAGTDAPSHKVQIRDNVIENVLGPEASGAGATEANDAALIVSSSDFNFNFLTRPVNGDISVRRNFVAGSGRAGMWIGEVENGVVADNLVLRWNQFPNLPVWGANPFPMDFAQPLVRRFNSGVEQFGNQFDDASDVATAVDLIPASGSVGLAGANGQFFVLPVITAFEWLAVSDSTWIEIQDAAVVSGGGVVRYVVAPNESGDAREGVIRVGGSEFVVRQAGGKTL